MEVLHRPGAFYASQMATLYPPAMQRMFTAPPDLYSCYSFQINTPSRSPTPERPFMTYPKHANSLGIADHPTTLQSVLRGEVPPAYSHLTTPSSGPSISPYLKSPSSISTHNLSSELDSLHPAMSPCLSVHSSLSYSPRPSSRESFTSQDSDQQTEPMDLSYKRSTRKRTANSAFSEPSSRNNSTPVLSSSLPAKLSSSRRLSSEFLSTSSSLFPSSSSPSIHRSPPSPNEGQHLEFSLLRNLLSVGKHHSTRSTPNLSSDRACDSPASDSFPRASVTGYTKVQLAKKNLFPVSARVSDWLVKFVQFAKSIPEFSTLSYNDKITLVLNSWTPIMLLYMAESHFQFAVTPIPAKEGTSAESISSQDEPTMKAVEGLQTFIKKCQNMSMDAKEYEFFRMLVLFNSGYPGLSSPSTVDQLSSVVQQLLQQHVRVSRPSDPMHYSRLLMCLPSLYSTNSKMFETLFCKHITNNTDMEVLLKELLQNIA